jgi:hypothetical protein
MRKLGKKPARASTTLAFRDFFYAPNLPVPPATFGHQDLVDEWHMLGNDAWGDCVWAGAAHLEYAWSLMGGRPRVRITTADVLSDYATVTGFAYTDATDQGTDMQAGAEYWRTTGIRDAISATSRHKIDCHVSLSIGDWDQMILATYLFGGCGIGIELPQSAMSQNDLAVPWTVTNSKIEGGHFVPAVGRVASGNVAVITWGTVQEMTQAFYERYSDEARAYLSLDILDAKGLSPEGFDATALRAYTANLGA